MPSVRSTVVAALLVLGAAAGLEAQPLQRPAEWRVRYDDVDARPEDLYFVAMPPGWHITTGPSGIFWDPANTAAGAYRIEADIHLFPGERDEGFGVFIGGTALEGPDQTYVYFLLRRDGRFVIKRRSGGSVSTLVSWTAHPAIRPHPGGADPVPNAMAVDVGAVDLGFFVNGAEVARLRRADLPVDGVYGLRVNHHLDLHVVRLERVGT